MILPSICNHPSHVYDGASADAGIEYHASGNSGQCDSFGFDLQCHYHSGIDPNRYERGKIQTDESGKMLLRNMGVYGLGGIIVPFWELS